MPDFGMQLVRAMDLQDLLVAKKPSDNPARLPTAAVAAQHVRKAMARVPGDWAGADWCVADNVSVQFGGEHGPPPSRMLPTVTKGNVNGPWIGSRGKRMSVEELARAMGRTAMDAEWPDSRRAAVSLLGNSMAANVLEEILVAALVGLQAVPAETVSMWHTEVRAAELRADAALEDAARVGGRATARDARQASIRDFFQSRAAGSSAGPTG
eukprot:4945753-Alexandrium_andersonii.AAC.1